MVLIANAPVQRVETIRAPATVVKLPHGSDPPHRVAVYLTEVQRQPPLFNAQHRSAAIEVKRSRWRAAVTVALTIVWPVAGALLGCFSLGRLIVNEALRPFQRRALRGLDNRLPISQVITLLWIPNISIWASVGVSEGFRQMSADRAGGWSTVLTCSVLATALTVVITVMLAKHTTGESQFLWDPSVDVVTGVPELIDLQRNNAHGYTYPAATASGIAEGLDRGWGDERAWPVSSVLKYSLTNHRRLIAYQLAASVSWLVLPFAWIGIQGLGWRTLIVMAAIVAIPLTNITQHRVSSLQYQIWSARYRVLFARLEALRDRADCPPGTHVRAKLVDWFASLRMTK